MRVLLINPPSNLKKMLGKFEKLMEPMPCIGLAYVASMLERNDIEVKIIDAYAENMGIKNIVNIVIKKFKPDVIGISSLTPTAYTTIKLIEKIKKYNRNIKIVLGNLHSNLFATDMLQRGADIIIKGEGEYSTVEVLKALENGMELGKIDGIVFKEKGQIIETPSRPLIKDLDKLPYPAWHLFPYKKYRALPFTNLKRPIIGVLASRGCPYKCIFCSRGYLKSIYRMRNAKKVVDEIEFSIEKYGAKQIAFMDLIFPLTKRQGLDFCDEMVSRGINKKVLWTTETRVDKIDRELLEKMKEAGCGRLMFGIESGVQELLNKVKKNFSLEDVRKAVRLTHEVGIKTVGFFMLGLPDETREMSIRTIEFAKKLDLDFAKFAITTPFPGSELFDLALKEEKINLKELKDKDWEMFSPFNPRADKLIYIPNGMSGKDLVELHRRATYEFYMRPKVILNQLFKVRTVSIKQMLYGIRAILPSS